MSGREIYFVSVSWNISILIILWHINLFCDSIFRPSLNLASPFILTLNIRQPMAENSRYAVTQPSKSYKVRLIFLGEGQCAQWNEKAGNFTTSGCYTLGNLSNSTHTTCQCTTPQGTTTGGSFALISGDAFATLVADTVDVDANGQVGSVEGEFIGRNWIFLVIVALISSLVVIFVLCIAVVVLYCRGQQRHLQSGVSNELNKIK